MDADKGGVPVAGIDEILPQIDQVLILADVTDVEKRNVVGRVAEQVHCQGKEGPDPGGVEMVFLPGLFDQLFGASCPDGGTLIDQPTTIERKVSQPSAKTRITCGIVKARKTHISQKCHRRA